LKRKRRKIKKNNRFNKHKRLKVLFVLGAIVILAIGWVGIGSLQGSLEGFFLWEIYEESPLIAKTLNIPSFMNPARNWKVKHIEIDAKAIASADISNSGETKFLFQKDVQKILPIASLTKLMTAHVALENYKLNKQIKITEKAVSQDEDRGNLKEGEILTVENLLYIALVESSNDAAFALTIPIGEEMFVDLMNSEARKMGLTSTYFGNPTGLDPDRYSTSTPATVSINYSTAEDLVKLSSHLFKENPKVWDILSTKEYNLKKPNGQPHHKIETTNELLADMPEIVGGKTGWTPMAGGCLLIATKKPIKNGYLINVILGAQEKFKEMKKLIKWVDKAYIWR